jgi:hypothetical protein
MSWPNILRRLENNISQAIIFIDARSNSDAAQPVFLIPLAGGREAAKEGLPIMLNEF